MYQLVKMMFLAVCAFGALLAGAVPVRMRQIGDLQCNINRLQIVGDLAGLQGTLGALSGEASGNATANEAIQSVRTDITGAQGAIGVIAEALLTGQDAPADARDQVAGNLTSAQNTLSTITLSSTAGTATLQKAQTELSSAITAGEGVVNNCN